MWYKDKFVKERKVSSMRKEIRRRQKERLGNWGSRKKSCVERGSEGLEE